MKKINLPIFVACALAWFGHSSSSMATGKLAAQYCAVHGVYGLVTGVAVWTTSVVFMWVVMEYARLTNAKNYKELVGTIYSAKPIVGKVMNVAWDLITLFSVGVVSGSCVAGAGALFESLFNIPYVVGMLFFVAITLLLFLSGSGIVKKLARMSLFLVVLLLIYYVIFIITGFDNLLAFFAGEHNIHIDSTKMNVTSAVGDGVVYAMSVSGFVSTSILYATQFKSRKETTLACIIAYIIGVLAISASILSTFAWFPEASANTLPFFYIVETLSAYSPLISIVYSLILTIAYFSTASSLLTGGISRYKVILGKFVKNEKACTAMLIVFFLSVSSISGSFGLDAIIDVGYRMLGTARIWLWLVPIVIIGPFSIRRVSKTVK